ncbi:MAG: hypothetical protein IJH60_08620 [Eubacterium sp.]|nr:hypothetical protein [Eubacterium sp.]
MRLIDADELKRNISKTIIDLSSNCKDRNLLDLGEVETLIDKAPAIVQWTLVTRGLPTIILIHEDDEGRSFESDVCIVTTKDKLVTCARYCHDEHFETEEMTSDFWLEEVTDRVLDVIAWMSLPEPYKENET